MKQLSGVFFLQKLLSTQNLMQVVFLETNDKKTRTSSIIFHPPARSMCSSPHRSRALVPMVPASVMAIFFCPPWVEINSPGLGFYSNLIQRKTSPTCDFMAAYQGNLWGRSPGPLALGFLLATRPKRYHILGQWNPPLRMKEIDKGLPT